VSASGGSKAIIAAFLANTGIALTKFIAFLFSGSSSTETIVLRSED
jgi:divalent metal cation (Fe/Co/Zn/Cd) transporter